ncbi:MAG: phasin family protein [Gammaproteobacteria bacterium]|nr:phasin family protein [Gammaproteobacteria bacterium]NNF62206.1 poly granule associated protein [Gammaproteobacteria bacterium]NNM20581.1 poly granule associated protein [Gammaproteobacteria bacterium]
MNQKPDPDKLARVITESAHQIWSAGLGALSMAEKEGSKLFETLAKLGENIQSHTRNTAGVAKSTVTGGRDMASDTWEKLEEMFELRVARALNGLQIPTARDIHELSTRVDKLSSAVDKLNAKQKARRKTAKKKKAKKKKKSSSKKSKAKKKKNQMKKTKHKKSGGK